ncbi:MAG TPA: rhomboid family intramembrane serine protease [Stenotrophomonas sp.]|nr:rhomboid family intramembrane serine protease [Stenotrophomonas sp.]
MLILPLHKPLTWATWPWMTSVLLLVNVLVFFGPQSGDRDAMLAAQRYYAQSGLAEQEMPAYRRYLVDSGRGDEIAAFEAADESEQWQQLAQASVNDLGFRSYLSSKGPDTDAEANARWRPTRAEYDRRLDDIFTLRHMQRSSEWSPWRMLSAAFLHADPMHLIGNMVFLVALGLLLEGAIGAWWLLAVYVVGAYGSSAASVLWRWGEYGGGLGASGAIAAMMGAFCAVWGRQPVRFFYWFGVVFDYVRAPAILLFPLWLGWEIFNLLSDDGAGIAFEAHAGGLVTGALLGGLLVWMRQTRPAFLADEGTLQAVDDRWERAQRHLGRMENAEAEALLGQLAAEQPQRFEVALARCRVARNGGQRAALQRHASTVLGLRAMDAAQVQAQWGLMQAAFAEGWAPAAEVRAALVTQWLALGHLQEAEGLLDLEGEAGARETQAQLLLKLALAHGARRQMEQQQRLLSRLLAQFPEQPQAQKARFLLDNA